MLISRGPNKNLREIKRARTQEETQDGRRCAALGKFTVNKLFTLSRAVFFARPIKIRLYDRKFIHTIVAAGRDTRERQSRADATDFRPFLSASCYTDARRRGALASSESAARAAHAEVGAAREYYLGYRREFKAVVGKERDSESE